MYRTLVCLTAEHKAWVIPLSAAICWLSCQITFYLLRQARQGRDWSALAWTAAAGIAAGAGTWSTHFIAMLGYDPGLGIGYELVPTLASFGVAIAASCCAFVLLGSSERLAVTLSSGILLGLGVAAMHFTGMSGVRIPGRFVWDGALVACAIVAGLVLTCLSLLAFKRGLTRHPGAVAAILLTAAIAVLHFVAMGAAQAVPDPSASQPDESLDRGALAIGIASVMLAIFAFCVLALFTDHLRRVNRALAAQGSVLRESEERLARALDAGSDGLWDWNIATGKTWFSDRWFTLLGYEPGEFPADVSTWQRLVHPDDMPRAQEMLAAHFEGRSPVYECEHRLRCKDGGWGWILTRGKVVERDAQGQPLRIVGTHIDIAARKAVESQVAHMARHDGLTGLVNRTHFHELFNRALADAERAGGRCAVLCLDLDRFKAVNDTLGHLAGDELLKQVADRLRRRIRPNDTVARLGGDEFAVLVGGDPTDAFLDRTARDLIAAVGDPVNCDDHVIDVGLSIGIAIAPDHGLDEELLFRRADLALYRAKAEGRNTHRVFDPTMDEAEAGRRDIERELRRAIAEDGLDLHFQPQVRAATGEVLGFEALVRWPHPTRGSIPPSTFIPLAEETGTIAPLGEWVLRSACTEAARWARPLKIAVNLSPRQFQQVDLPDLILGILTETGLSPARLEIEVTETAIFADMNRALTLIRRLKALGISIAMDDFGTGYSSLATLQAFPFDKIKIDRSFVGQIGSSLQAAVIVRAVLGLGRNLGIGVVAEGVETAEQRDFLIAEACDELQGYFFGRPQPIERFASLVHDPGADRPAQIGRIPEAVPPSLERVA